MLPSGTPLSPTPLSSHGWGLVFGPPLKEIVLRDFTATPSLYHPVILA